jgi:hypothetical protein
MSLFEFLVTVSSLTAGFYYYMHHDEEPKAEDHAQSLKGNLTITITN